MDWTQFMIAAAGLVITGVVVPLLHAAFAWLKGKTQNETLLTALDEAKEVADNVVLSLEATVVKGIKQKSEDGKLTPKEAKEVAETALNLFLMDLSARSTELIQNNSDDVAAYVGRLIEARLQRLKGGGRT